MTDSPIDFASLPEVDSTSRAVQQRRPRFDGDVSAMPDRACWALQHLLTRRYISSESDREIGLALASTARGLELEPDNAFCLTIDGFAQTNLKKRLDLSAARYDLAIDTTPSCAIAWLTRFCTSTWARSALVPGLKVIRISAEPEVSVADSK